MKNILIVTGLVFLFYSCTPTKAQPIQPTQEQISNCYAKVNEGVRDDWKYLNPVQRLTVGMRAISVCEGGK